MTIPERRRCKTCGHVNRGLTKEDVRAIYLSELPTGEIAKEVGRSRQLVWLIKRRKFRAEWLDGLDA